MSAITPKSAGATAGAGSVGILTEGDLRGIGAEGMFVFPFTALGPTSYDTGGSALTLPVIKGYKFHSVVLGGWNNGTRMYAWTGTVNASGQPLIKALTALPNTEVAGATNLAADTFTGVILFEK